MKAAANGALNLSVLDGWWIEGFAANPDTGWGIEPSELMDGKGDAADGDAIYPRATGRAALLRTR